MNPTSDTTPLQRLNARLRSWKLRFQSTWLWRQMLRRLWVYNLVLAFVAGGFFTFVYNAFNLATSLRGGIGSLYYDWETSIPFIPELVVPYLSFDLVFGLAFLLCKSRINIRRNSAHFR